MAGGDLSAREPLQMLQKVPLRLLIILFHRRHPTRLWRSICGLTLGVAVTSMGPISLALTAVSGLSLIVFLNRFCCFWPSVQTAKLFPTFKRLDSFVSSFWH